jgi:hypothetical protein
MQVGMRYFNLKKNKYFCPIINLDKLWSLVGEEVSAAGRELWGEGALEVARS